MTAERFGYQRSCVAATTGKVLNIGANEDPAGLKAIDPDRVDNADIESHDSYMNRPNLVDIVFDATQKWPLEDDSYELVVLGDILEHLYPDEAAVVLTEANRCAPKLCITVPKDDRINPETIELRNGYRTHCYVWTDDKIRRILEETGWRVTDWQTVDYLFVAEGYFIQAERVI